MEQKVIDLQELEFDLDFLKSDTEDPLVVKGTYKVMIADDDEEVHAITKLMLKDFEFEGKGLQFIDTYSGTQTIEAMAQNPDTALLFLDVVMEDHLSGLKVVEYVRNTLANKLTRIILRTGQPGEAPEERVIRDYDINDYRLKTELTIQRIKTTLYSALRNYRDLITIEKSKQGLEWIVNTSADLFRHNTMSDLLKGILVQLSSLNPNNKVPDPLDKDHNCFIFLNHHQQYNIVAATGSFEKYIGQDVRDIVALNFVADWVNNRQHDHLEMAYHEKGYIIKTAGQKSKNYIFIEGSEEDFSTDLLQLFLSHYSLALDNYILNNLIYDTQEEVIITLGEVIEKHSEDTAGHVRRVAQMMDHFAKICGLSPRECEILKLASAMHDVGKIGIPDHIIKKPGQLTPEEYQVVKEHSKIGYDILSRSKLDILGSAASIALNHHEKYNGTGYPSGLKGKEIPLYARMMSIVDVFDAVTHERCYKEAWPMDEAVDYLKTEKGHHFDPDLVDLFLENLDKIMDALK